MDIEDMALNFNVAKLQMSAGYSTMRKSMDMVKENMAEMTRMMEMNRAAMERSVNPHIGGNLDIQI